MNIYTNKIQPKANRMGREKEKLPAASSRSAARPGEVNMPDDQTLPIGRGKCLSHQLHLQQ